MRRGKAGGGGVRRGEEEKMSNIVLGPDWTRQTHQH